MKRIDQIIRPLRAPAKHDRNSERGDLIKFFTDKVNADRDGKKYRKLPISAIAVKLSHLSLADLYYLKSDCTDAERRGKPFAAVFWWSIKPKPEI
jgi:hypothetical protein